VTDEQDEPWYVTVVASAERGLARIPEKVVVACLDVTGQVPDGG